MDSIDVYIEQRCDVIRSLEAKVERALSLRKESGTGGLRVLSGIVYDLFQARLEVERLILFRQVHKRAPRGGEAEGGSDDGSLGELVEEVLRNPPEPTQALRDLMRPPTASPPPRREVGLIASPVIATSPDGTEIRGVGYSKPEWEPRFVHGVRTALNWVARTRTDNVSPEKDLEEVLDWVFQQSTVSDGSKSG